MFLVDFFSDSPAKAEWRVLMAYLQRLEDDFEEKGGQGIPTGRPLQQVTSLLPLSPFIGKTMLASATINQNRRGISGNCMVCVHQM